MRPWIVIGIVLIAIAAIPLPHESAFQRAFDVLTASFWGFAIATELEEARAKKRWVR